jgi:Na+/proline symporter
MDEWWPVSVALAIVGVGLAVLLLFSGIGLVKRRAWTQRTCMIWAGLRMSLVVANALVGYAVQKQTLAAMEGQNAQMPPGWGAISGSMPLMTVCFTLLWGWALPVFLQIWLARGTIKEEMARWQ